MQQHLSHRSLKLNLHQRHLLMKQSQRTRPLGMHHRLKHLPQLPQVRER